MEAKTKQEIDSIIRELNAIVKELDSISYGIANEFKGIGSSRCAITIRALSEKYRNVKNELMNIK
jgi:hypothetical protein